MASGSSSPPLRSGGPIEAPPSTEQLKTPTPSPPLRSGGPIEAPETHATPLTLRGSPPLRSGGPIEAPVKWQNQDRSKAGDEHLQAAQHTRLNAVANSWAIHLTANEPDLFEDFQMLRNCRLGERQLVHDVATDTGRPADQDAEDLHSRRVSDGLGQGGDLLGGFFPLDWAQIRFDARRWVALGGCLLDHRRYTMVKPLPPVKPRPVAVSARPRRGGGVVAGTASGCASGLACEIGTPASEGSRGPEQVRFACGPSGGCQSQALPFVHPREELSFEAKHEVEHAWSSRPNRGGEAKATLRERRLRRPRHGALPRSPRPLLSRALSRARRARRPTCPGEPGGATAAHAAGSPGAAEQRGGAGQRRGPRSPQTWLGPVTSN